MCVESYACEFTINSNVNHLLPELFKYKQFFEENTFIIKWYNNEKSLNSFNSNMYLLHGDKLVSGYPVSLETQILFSTQW